MTMFTEVVPPAKPEVPNVADIRYQTPFRKDMAVCFVFFNPAKSKRMLMNYLYTVEKLKCASIPYYTMELVYGSADPEIKDAFHVRSKTVMFHKEQLCRLLERKVSWWYSKLLFLDADLIFGDVGWYSKVSEALNKNDIVQPFTSAVWMDITYTKALQERKSAVLMDRTKTYDSTYHPGFAWAFRRKWFRTYGFYEYGITGSGDTMSSAAWLSVDFKPNFLKTAFLKTFEEYKNNPKPRIACVSGKIYHLFHGITANRKYVDRHLIVKDIPDIKKIVRANWFGVFEVTDRKVADQMRDYFVNRQDDGI